MSPAEVRRRRKIRSENPTATPTIKRAAIPECAHDASKYPVTNGHLCPALDNIPRPHRAMLDVDDVRATKAVTTKLTFTSIAATKVVPTSLLLVRSSAITNPGLNAI